MKSNHIRRSKRKHFKQLKRNAKKEKLRIEAIDKERTEKRNLLLKKNEDE